MILDAVEPSSSLDTEPYWAGCRDGKLLYQTCDDCSEVVFHPRALCPYCLSSNLSWTQSRGHGRIYSISVQHVALRPTDTPFTPRALGIIEMDEGFHLFSEVLADDPAAPKIGDRVVVEFHPLNARFTLPKFRPVHDDA